MSERPQPEPLLIDERTAAKRLSLSPSMLKHLRQTGQIPHRQYGRRVLYHPDELREWAARTGKVEGRRQDEPIALAKGDVVS